MHACFVIVICFHNLPIHISSYLYFFFFCPSFFEPHTSHPNGHLSFMISFKHHLPPYYAFSPHTPDSQPTGSPLCYSSLTLTPPPHDSISPVAFRRRFTLRCSFFFFSFSLSLPFDLARFSFHLPCIHPSTNVSSRFRSLGPASHPSI